jgi:hypothetical protein
MASEIDTYPPSAEAERRPPASLELVLRVTDPEVVAALHATPEGPERRALALAALRIGILALRQAQGRLDADAMRNEGALLLKDLEARLQEHRASVSQQLERSLKEYFDPQSGRFHERVERLVRKDGDLEQMLRRQIGTEDSALARTLAAHFGRESPLMRLLSPSESEGVLQSMAQTLEAALAGQRERILREFSLDDKQSALSRLVLELKERHGELNADLKGSVEKVVGEFSLDNEGSALNRLVGRVDAAQKQISRELTLDESTSALARMRKELLDVLDAHRQSSAAFQEEVKVALAAMAARKEESLRSTRHGGDFEGALFAFVQQRAQAAGDVAEATGNTVGLIKNTKVGDAVVTLGPESAAPGGKVVLEAKEVQGYGLKEALAEMEVARKNRGAEIGVFVFSRRTAPQGLAPFARYGQDVVVVWDAEDPATDVYLDAGLTVSRALVTRQAGEREDRAADYEAIERAIRAIEKQAQGLEEITRLTKTIRSNSENVLDRARIMGDELARQVQALDTHFGDLRRQG